MSSAPADDVRRAGVSVAVGRAPATIRRLCITHAERIRLAVVGAGNWIADVALFTVFIHVGMDSLLAKVLSAIISTTSSFVWNRLWTFRRDPRARGGLHREYALFLAVNAICLLTGLVCLLVSQHLLALRTPLEDNISANGVGMAIGMMLRVWAYRKFVFTTSDDVLPGVTSDEPVEPVDDDGARPEGNGRRRRNALVRPSASSRAG